MNPLRQHAKVLLLHVWYYVLATFLPNKVKRITYLATLHARLVRDGVFQQELLGKVNQTLQIVKDERALITTASMYKRLWGDEQIRPLFKHTDFSKSMCLPYDEAERISQELVNMMPDWLRYAKTQDMIVDTLKLFYCQPLSNSKSFLPA